MTCFNRGGIALTNCNFNALLPTTGRRRFVYLRPTEGTFRKAVVPLQSLEFVHHRQMKFLSTFTSPLPSSFMYKGELGVLKSLRAVVVTNQAYCFHTANISPQQRDNSTKATVLPNLMDFPLLMWPSVFKTLRNWFFYHFVIRAYMDNEFNMGEFDRGARQAVSIVAKSLMSGKFDELEGLVDREALEEVKRKVSTFSVFQRELLNVDIEDIFFSFPYQIGIIIPDVMDPTHRQSSQFSDSGDSPENRPPQKRYVEITVVFHILRGFAKRSEKAELKSLREFIQSEEDRNNVMVCNYRFFRDFTQGVENPTWIINMINHFLPADHANQSQ